MADLNEILADPDFLASSAETKRQILSAHDTDFAASQPATQDQIIARYRVRLASEADAPGIASTVNAGLKAARDWMQPAANNLVNFAGDLASDFVHPGQGLDRAIAGPRSLFAGPSAETRAAPSSTVGRIAAEVVNPVPSSITDVGAQIGTMGMSKWGILSRILGGAGGAGIGKALEGGNAADVATATGIGGASNIVGEGLAGGLSLGAKSIPGAVSRIRHKDATRMLDAAPDVSAGLGRPSLEGRTASEALQDLVTKGKTGLNDAKEEAVQRIESVLQSPTNRVPTGPPPFLQGSKPRPATANPGPTEDTFWRRFADRETPPGDAPSRYTPWEPKQSLIGPRGVLLDMPSIGRPVTLREANAELTAIGEGLRHQTILDPTMRQREAGKAYAILSKEIEQGLDAQSPGLGAAFREAQQAYASGLDYLKKIAGPNNWQPGSGGIEFDSRFLQKGLAKDPLGAQRAGERMGAEGNEAFVSALTRGEGLGRVDKVPSGGGGAADALMEWLRGSKSGSWGLPQAVIRSAVPNLGAQYIGRKPYSMDAGIKALIDLGILKGADAMRTAE